MIGWLTDWFMVFNVTFNNISVILRWSVLLVVETGVAGENHWPAASNWQTWSHNVSSAPAWAGFKLTTLVVIGTNCIGSHKSNYHTITTMMAPAQSLVKMCSFPLFVFFSFFLAIVCPFSIDCFSLAFGIFKPFFLIPYYPIISFVTKKYKCHLPTKKNVRLDYLMNENNVMVSPSNA